MELWFKGIAASLAGSLALYLHPGLETTQNFITSGLQISGQLVNLIWLFLAFTWAFIGVLAGYSIPAVLLYYSANRRGQTTDNRTERCLR